MTNANETFDVLEWWNDRRKFSGTFCNKTPPKNGPNSDLASCLVTSGERYEHDTFTYWPANGKNPKERQSRADRIGRLTQLQNDIVCFSC